MTHVPLPPLVLAFFLLCLSVCVCVCVLHWSTGALLCTTFLFVLYRLRQVCFSLHHFFAELGVFSSFLLSPACFPSFKLPLSFLNRGHYRPFLRLMCTCVCVVSPPLTEERMVGAGASLHECRVQPRTHQATKQKKSQKEEKPKQNKGDRLQEKDGKTDATTVETTRERLRSQ